MSKNNPNVYFCTFTDTLIRIHDATTGMVVATRTVPLSSGAYITNVSADTTGQYVTVSCSNRKIFVFKKSGARSWNIYRQYLR